MIATDSGSTIHLIWADSMSGNRDLYHRVYDGSTWYPSERLTHTILHEQAPHLAVDNDNNVHLVYLQGKPGDFYDLMYRKWNYVSGSWESPEILVSDTVPRQVYGPKVATDQFGFVHVIWSDTRHAGTWELYYKKYDPYDPVPLKTFCRIMILLSLAFCSGYFIIKRIF